MARDKVLIMLDARVIATKISREVESQLSFRTCIANDMVEAKKILKESSSELLAAVVNPNFCKTVENEAINTVLRNRLPCLVVTASFSDEMRNQLTELGVMDYFLKDARLIESVTKTLRRLKRNSSVQILVVDDSPVATQRLRQLLQRQGFQICQALDGCAALEIIARNPDVRLVLTDYEMPHMDGIALTRTIRQNADRDQIAIIGVSASSDRSSLSAEFLKNGADDFLPKSYLPEEFYCRINHNLDLLDHIDALRQAREEAERTARTDVLTGACNRRAFLEQGHSELSRSRRTSKPLSVLVLDIDHFKQINDQHGHATGDVALQSAADTVIRCLRKYDVFGRLGGEEFAALLPNAPLRRAAEVAERIRAALSNITVESEAGGTVQFTVSIGVCDAKCDDDSIEATLSRADQALYEAKRAGRNRVVIFNDQHCEPDAPETPDAPDAPEVTDAEVIPDTPENAA